MREGDGLWLCDERGVQKSGAVSGQLVGRRARTTTRSSFFPLRAVGNDGLADDTDSGEE